MRKVRPGESKIKQLHLDAELELISGSLAIKYSSFPEGNWDKKGRICHL